MKLIRGRSKRFDLTRSAFYSVKDHYIYKNTATLLHLWRVQSATAIQFLEVEWRRSATVLPQFLLLFSVISNTKQASCCRPQGVNRLLLDCIRASSAKTEPYFTKSKFSAFASILEWSRLTRPGWTQGTAVVSLVLKMFPLILLKYIHLTVIPLRCTQRRHTT